MPVGSPISDFVFVAKEAYNQGDFENAILWLKSALASFQDSEPHSDSELNNQTSKQAKIESLDYLAFSYFEMNNIQQALFASKELLNLDPKNSRIANNVVYYQNMLTEQLSSNTTELSNEVNNIKQAMQVSDKTVANDNLLRHSHADMSSFRSICRGNFSYLSNSTMGYCEYLPNTRYFPQVLMP